MMTAEAAVLAANIHAALLQLLATNQITEEGAMHIFTILNKEH
jgi:hypothetical protein